MIEMRLRSIKISDTADRQFIHLVEREGERILPIVIGYSEAQAIDRFVKEQTFARPLTHDLLATVVQAVGAKVAYVHITELSEGTFYALIRMTLADESVIEVDARPSDAIALATATKAPLFVNESVLEAAAELPQ